MPAIAPVMLFVMLQPVRRVLGEKPWAYLSAMICPLYKMIKALVFMEPSSFFSVKISFTALVIFIESMFEGNVPDNLFPIGHGMESVFMFSCFGRMKRWERNSFSDKSLTSVAPRPFLKMALREARPKSEHETDESL
jgi:hypothetical protein